MEPLLTTKFYIPPTNIEIVQRSHLYARLDESLMRKLTLVSAPTGFGKSTLVTGWLSERNQPAAWLSLDPGDNDPVRFWIYLIAAIQTLHNEIGEEARQILSATKLRSTELVATRLINDIAQLAQNLFVVLDDYHVIETEQVHASLSYLIENQPPNLHIILITRIDPPISLARLRVHRQLVEIRAEDLQFSIKEAEILFNEKMGLNLNLEHIKALKTHTESWIVGLQLAGLTLKGQPSYDTFIKEFTGGHQFILDYLTEEVLDTLPAREREFLLRTSILERFCGQLCQAVTGDPDSQQLLGEIRKKNLFLVPLDTGGHWFRYQHLFAEVLYTLLARDHSEEIGALHLKAAAWYEREGFPGEAVEHALQSFDTTQAREYVLKHWLVVLHRGEIATVLRWLDALPAEIERDDPSLSLARCWALFLSWQNSAIEPHLEQANYAYTRLVSEGALHGVQQDFVAAQLAMMRSVLARARGEHIMSVAYAEEAARLIPQELMEGIGTGWNMLAAARAGAGDFDGALTAYEHGITLAYAEGNLIGAYGCTYGQAMYMLVQGRLNEAEKLCLSIIDRAEREEHGDFPAAGSLYIAMARIKLERYQLGEAEAFLNTGLRIARPGGFGEAMRAGRYTRTQLFTANGKLEAAKAIFQDTERILNVLDDPYLTGELNYQWAMHCIKAGDLNAAREKLVIMEETIKVTQHGNLLLWWGWLSPRLLWAEKRYKEAFAALDESIGRARAANSNGELIRLLVLKALVMERLGDHAPSLSAGREALALGASGGYILRWLDAGAGIGPLLRNLRDDRDTPQAFHHYLESLLSAFHTTFGEPVRIRSGNLPDPLTPRELEIMRLICQGYSNPEIASELVVTLNTIKKHTSNIYGKLGVSSRTQAIARVHVLGLI